MSGDDPEIGKSVTAAGLKTNYLESGNGHPVVLIHGSGPGVTAYANWRLTIPRLSENYRVVAPDMAGFGYTERAAGVTYDLDYWLAHLLGFLDALDLEKVSLVGNSFGGALTLAFAAKYPERVDRFVLMGAAGIEFELTPGLDVAWGYEPSPENMRELINLFAYNKALITDDLIRSRHEASIRPGFHETYSAMFPAPRQRHIAALATPEEKVKAIDKAALIIHGRDDQIIPLASSLRLLHLLERSQLHVFGQCGHWTQVEHSDRFCRLVGDFFSESDG